MTILAIIFLILLGLILLILEFAVIPGFTIAGIGGVAMLIASIYLAFSEYGTLAGFITLLTVLVSAPLLFYYFFKTRAGKKMVLNTKIEGKVEAFDPLKIQPGDTGITIGRLAPSGKVKVNGEVADAQSTGSFIDPIKPVRVVRVIPNKVIVELIINE
jgi:membrane-bound ClpP family serine protease